MNRPQTSSIWDRLLPWAVALILLLFYLSFEQANLHDDSIMFLSEYASRDALVHPYHISFSYILGIYLWFGRALGLANLSAGLLFVGVIASLSLVFYYRLLRRVGVGIWMAGLFTALLGLSATVIEFATTVELYALCLLAVILSLYAFLSVTGRRKKRDTLGLWLSCFFVLSLHAGFSLWVAAIYLTLIWRDRSDRLKALSWLFQAGATAAVYTGWLFFEGRLETIFLDQNIGFFNTYWSKEAPGNFVWLLFRAPLFQFALFAGLLTFPAPAGWQALRKRMPEVGQLGVLATAGFFCCYAAWVTDVGAFYIPLLPVWGLFAACAMERWLHSRAWPLLAFLFAPGYALLFMVVPLGNDHNGFSLQNIAWVSAFYVTAALLLFTGNRLIQDKAFKNSPFIPMAVFTLVAVGMTGLAYLPRTIELSKPNKISAALIEFAEQAPGNARLVAGVWSTRAHVQTNRECIDAKTLDQKGTAQLARWLQESQIENGNPVYFDSHCHDCREDIWKGMIETVSPLSNWQFVPMRTKQHIFYRVDPK